MWMKRALVLAAKGKGRTNPAPMVGCVVVKENTVVGEGYYKCFGGDRAESKALTQARESAKKSTLYMNIEPDLSSIGEILKSGVRQVSIAILNPDSSMAGKSIEALKAAGIAVEIGEEEQEARRLNKVYFKFSRHKTPYVLLKVGMSLDGKIATYTKDSQWISCPESLQYVHEIRNEVTGIMVGIGTVLADNPSLTTRLENIQTRDPIRIVLDSSGRIPIEAKVLGPNPFGKNIIATTYKIPREKRIQLQNTGAEIIQTSGEQIQMEELMIELGKRNIDHILLEGGSTVNWAAIEAGVVDEVMVSIAPKIIGGKDAYTPIEGRGFSYLRDVAQIEDLQIQRVGQDVLLRGLIQKKEGKEA